MITAEQKAAIKRIIERCVDEHRPSHTEVAAYLESIGLGDPDHCRMGIIPMLEGVGYFTEEELIMLG